MEVDRILIIRTFLKNLINKKIILVLFFAIPCFYYYQYKIEARKIVLNVAKGYNGYIVVFFNQKDSNVNDEFIFPYHRINVPENGIIRTSLKSSYALSCEITIDGCDINNYSLHLNDGKIKDLNTYGILIDEYGSLANGDNIQENDIVYSVSLITSYRRLNNIRYPDPSMLWRMYKNNSSGKINHWIKTPQASTTF